MISYRLQHKDNTIAIVDFEEGVEHPVFRKILDISHLPIALQGHVDYLQYWWKHRCNPRALQYDRIPLPHEDGYKTAYESMLQNLGLSTDDCYWMCPLDSDLSWVDVSFHSNAMDTWKYSPDATLQGRTPKRWMECDGVLTLSKKAEEGLSFHQSLNEVFASLLHRKQDFADYQAYRLTPDNSVCSTCFTSNSLEFIPAWQFFAKYGHVSGASRYDEYLEYLGREGLDKERMDEFLRYMLLTDFVISNEDRHLGNFGVLRNPDTLELVGPAPIFDSGCSMFYRNLTYVEDRELLDMKTRGLYGSESEMMRESWEYRDLLDISKLPTEEEVRNLYSTDPVLVPLLDRLMELYLYKMEMLK